MLAAEFRSLPVVTKRGSMQGFYDIAGIGSFQCGVKTTWIGKHLPSGAEVFERIDATALLLEDWEMSDLDRLAIVPPPPPPSASGAHAPDGLGHASIPAETTPTVNDVPGDLVPPNKSESTASLGLERATKIALAAAAEEHGRTDLSLVPDKTIESPAQWLFFYDTVGFLSTGDEAEALEVSYPIMVNRGTGEVSVLKRSSTSARRRSPEISTVRISLEGSNH